MKTNFQMLQDVKCHYRKRKYEIVSGIIHDNEVEVIEQTFKLKDRKLLDLQNLRDFIVSVMVKESTMFWDMFSAIVFVIDGWKIKLGGDV